jgi:hypothetical protein
MIMKKLTTVSIAIIATSLFVNAAALEAQEKPTTQQQTIVQKKGQLTAPIKATGEVESSKLKAQWESEYNKEVALRRKCANMSLPQIERRHYEVVNTINRLNQQEGTYDQIKKLIHERDILFDVRAFKEQEKLNDTEYERSRKTAEKPLSAAAKAQKAKCDDAELRRDACYEIHDGCREDKAKFSYFRKKTKAAEELFLAELAKFNELRDIKPTIIQVRPTENEK